jgi:hypothetical protein
MKQHAFIDNQAPASKLAIRQWALEAAGFKRLRVLDLCSGEGHIWREMKERGARVDEYVPVDRAPRQGGTIKGNIGEGMVEALNVPNFNVIDVDTYGSPWEIWSFIAKRITGRTAAFLTDGAAGSMTCGGVLTKFARSAMGIPAEWKIPNSNEVRLFAPPYALYASCMPVNIVSGGRIRVDGRWGQAVIYYGLVVEPRR